MLEHVAHARRADADKHLHKIRAADGEERHIRFACDSACQQCFARAGRANHEHALGNATAQFLEFFRITQKLDELLHFVFCFLDTGDIPKRDLVFVPGEHSRFRFPEIKRALSSHADLLAEQKVKHEQEKRDRQKTDYGLRQHVGFSFDGWLNTRGSELLLQIIREIQIDSGFERDLLRGRGTYSLANVNPAQRLSRPAIFDH